MTARVLTLFMMAMGLSACAGGPTTPSPPSQRCVSPPLECTTVVGLGGDAYSGCPTLPLDTGACHSFNSPSIACDARVCH
jgi:hypothetical protein